MLEERKLEHCAVTWHHGRDLLLSPAVADPVPYSGLLQTLP